MARLPGKRRREMIMSMTLPAPGAAHGGFRRSGTRPVGAILKRWWVAYITWRIEQLAIARLGAMSDRQLEDIGIGRSQIERAVRGSPDHGHDRLAIRRSWEDMSWRAM